MPDTAPRAPVRTCVACRTARPQGQLLRIARTPEGVRADDTDRHPGRGAYVCPDPRCLDAARRRDAAALRRALRGGTAPEIDAALDILSGKVRLRGADGTVRSEHA
ncbi:MAG: YlxR family protein [Nitriliruptoraceae bacterium]|nr:YlxR family protein [Nitriliruptoraceae bacterium]